MGDRRDKPTLEAAEDAPYWTDNLSGAFPASSQAPTYEEAAGDRRRTGGVTNKATNKYPGTVKYAAR